MFTELHYHTKETSFCGQVSAYGSIPIYKKFGYDAVVVTDHFARCYFADYYSGIKSWDESLYDWLSGYHCAKLAGDKCGIKVFLGCEISFDHYVDNDFLVYGLTEELLYNNPELWKMSYEEFKLFADTNGLFVAQAHPYRGWCTVCPKEFLHGIEMFNAHPRHNSSNHKAVQLWIETNLIPICGTDYHHSDAILGCGVRFNKTADTITEIKDMLFNREYELVIPSSYSYSPK